MQDRAVRREIVLPASRDDVWEALTDPDRLTEWFANEVDLDVRPGGEGRFRWGDGAERKATVELVDEPRRLELLWAEEGGDEASSVVFELEEVAEGTRLTVVESAGSELRACAGEWGLALELRAVLARPARV